jgi:L-alanine-DL-glutamate epimerase-like enolase superfamily enzyme
MVIIPYSTPYRIAPGTSKLLKRVFVFIDTDEGITGVGETGTTVPERGGETMESIYININQYFGPLIIGMDPFDIGPIIGRIEKAHWGHTGYPCSKCGIDNALYDIMGKSTDRPVAQILGGIHRTRFRVSRSLGVKPPKDMARDALNLVQHGYAMLTVKAGFNPKDDLERLAAVRDAVGQGFPLEVDVNGGYRVEDAVPTLRKMEKYDIEAVEQPVPWWDIKGLKEVRRAIGVPITADESAWSPFEVANLAKEGAVDTICIKPIKNGGLFLSRQVAEVADAAGMGVVMGSKHPLSLGTSAIRHFASAMPMVHDILGYGSPMERFIDDVTDDPLSMNSDGTVDLPDGPGFGVTVAAPKLEQYGLPDIQLPVPVG